jgi:hypothetical protein
MQFRLTYRGPLKAEGRNDGRVKEKHAIRRWLRPQLAELWRTHPFLRQFMQPHMRSRRLTTEATAATMEEMNQLLYITEYDDFSMAQKMAKEYAHKGYNFLPLVGHVFKGVETACSLDILFLRRDDPGKLVTQGGDIDNRIKTLLDALKMPKPAEFHPPEPAQPDEDPFFCLVQDDNLITEIKVTTDRLLAPLGVNEYENNVELVISVRTSLVGLHPDANMGATTAFQV